MDLSSAAASLLGANQPEDVQNITPSSGGILIETIGMKGQIDIARPTSGDATSVKTTNSEDGGIFSAKVTATGRPLRRTQETKMKQRAASTAAGLMNGGVSSLLEANSRFKHKRDLVYGATSTTTAYWATSKLIDANHVPQSVSWARVV